MEHPIAARQQAQADALFFSIGEGAIATDEKGNVSRINKAAREILEIREDDVLGQWFPGAVVAVDEEGNPVQPIDRSITRAVVEGASVSERTYYRTTSGRIVPVFVTVSPILLSGRPVGAIEVFRDISAELEIDRLKSDFISIASHQLRTPATAVKNFIGLLREGYVGELTDEQLFIVEQAYMSNETQLDIVNNLLYAARADSTSVRLKLEPHDLVTIIKESLDEQHSYIKERNQTLNVELPKQAKMVLDKHFIRMLVENLISNASKYTPDNGTIGIGLTATPQKVELRITDSGVGISKDDQTKLFQRFSRIENELSTIRGGSGIGLYLVKRIVTLHSGDIRVVSRVGKGSSFIVTLPREQ